MRTESQLIQAIGSADSLAQQASLIAELDALKAAKARTASIDGDIDLASTIVQATLTPVAVHTMHTAATDWLDDVTMSVEADLKTATNAMAAEASLWFTRTSADVKADHEEFGEQARGMARRLAGKYGEQAPAAAQAFLDYAAFLHRREAASGLDQVQQTTAPDGVTQRSTQLPQDTFDTFQQPVDPMNEGVDEMQNSMNAPLLQEILSNPGFPGAGVPEVPGGHSDTQQFNGPQTDGTGNPVGQFTAEMIGHLATPDGNSTVCGAGGARTSNKGAVNCPDCKAHPAMQPRTSSLIDAPSLAQGYLYNMDDFRKQAAQDADRKQCSAGDCDNKEADDREEDANSDGLCNLHARQKSNKERLGSRHPFGEVTAGYYDDLDEKAKENYGKHELEQGDPQPFSYNQGPKAHGEEAVVTDHPKGYGDHKVSAKDDTDMETCSWCTDEVPDSSLREQKDGARVCKNCLTEDSLKNKQASGKCKNCTNGNHTGTNGSENTKCTGGSCSCKCKKTAASGLPQIQQATDVHDEVAPTPMPQDVMFPLVGPFAQQQNTQGTGEAQPAAPLPGQGQGPQRQGSWIKTADEWTAPGNNVGSNNPLLGETFNGSEGSVAEPTNAMEKALQGGSGQGGSRHDSTQSVARKTASEGSKEFRKGFGFAANWKPSEPLVKKGSAEFEAGLFAGMRENTEAAQVAWVNRHEGRGGAFARRIAVARKYAATTTDLETMVPGASPDAGGNTPINGPGTTPPLAGGMDAAAPGGASPYNGADPLGSPVAPDPLLPISNYPQASDLGGKAAAFRKRVQAGILEANR